MAQDSSTAGELPRGILAFPGVRAGGAEMVRPAAPTPGPHEAGESWDSLCERLLDRWPQLTAGELEATHGQPVLLEALLEAKLGYARWLVEELFRPWHQQATRVSHPRGRVARGLLRLVSLSSLAGCGLLLH